ncbi:MULTISPECIES: DUF397 domain-containing protein [unclassified Actinopolyspora]|uniref:DUF397 domain-containing protein n=1 Tax=unclassified Actinopolyspora TaxID=2639451 RepID=UPI0013F5B94B|nr:MULTISPECIES: DUF397 domain-containing protein [unclassified Actinopolyspora]NHD18012.1 DUF397 domain-containing protein [Actinopolyspora sp. BKK2]NHE77885.1 DUF397 domain-containing protein [Actinopolyspora sp. BKK1]
MSTNTPLTGWFTSSYSGGNNNTCVEARFTTRGIDVRDSKNPRQGHLSFTTPQWSSFLADLHTQR